MEPGDLVQTRRTSVAGAKSPRQRVKRGAVETPPVQSVERALSVLEAVARSSEPVPLTHLTDVLGIDQSSVFRLANTLKRRGFLANPNGGKHYVLGPAVWRLSRGVRLESDAHQRLPRAGQGPRHAYG